MTDLQTEKARSLSVISSLATVAAIPWVVTSWVYAIHVARWVIR